MKQLLLAGFALALFSLAAPTRGQTTVTTMTVDAVNVGTWDISVIGIVQGENTPSTHTVSFPMVVDPQRATATERCYRMLLLALSKPGQYVAKIGPGVCTVALVAP